ncbi:trypsin-like serine peptidase [Allokutzneria oryzae]|uniref:Trypsin-like serine peptidase n=1 Tax=Allokutzneria oryzae TaxID=1378989 RepID=A0ABV5ZNA9_9PSEU
MRHPTHLAGLVAAALLTAVTAVPTAHATPDDVVAHQVATTAQEQQAIRDYWTPERIAALPTIPPSGKPPVDGPDGSGWYGGGDVTKTVGRLFFTEQGEDASCTATIVRSANGNTAVTGGHCVHNFNLIGEDPHWMDNLYFVPGFRDGTMPHGGFVPRLVITSRTWVEVPESSAHDQAFLVLNPGIDGRSAAETVGAGQEIAFDVPGAREAREFGYPRGASQPGHQGRPEFTGKRLAQCWGPAVENPGGAGQFGVPCDMGGGSSGGPRFTGFDVNAGRGTVVGVNTQSFRDGADIRHLGGPQFSATITRPLYDRASAA